jgi:hypothetical protein
MHMKSGKLYFKIFILLPGWWSFDLPVFSNYPTTKLFQVFSFLMSVSLDTSEFLGFGYLFSQFLKFTPSFQFVYNAEKMDTILAS